MASYETTQKQTHADLVNNYQQLSFREYEAAEMKAGWYFKTLNDLTRSEQCLSSLKQDLNTWSRTNSQNNRDLPANYKTLSFWQKLGVRDDLDKYLRKTVQYLFIRDLGKDLNDAGINETIDSVVRSLVRATNDKTMADSEALDTRLYRLAKKRGIETTYHWLVLKLSEMRELFHAHEAETEGMRKLVKIIAGVVMHQLVEYPDTDANSLSKTIKLGYCYGLTYPFIDDLLDTSPDLTEADKALFNQALRKTLQTGQVAPLPEFAKPTATIRRIYAELSWAFNHILQTLPQEQSSIFFRRAYVFFEAQAIDRQRRLDSNEAISMKSLFMPVMLKSAGCRLIARDLIECKSNSEFDHRTFCFGIYNQFNDDIKDIFEDLNENNLTPYTYYLKHKQPGVGTTSPYQYYWAVVYYLIYVVYQNEPTTKSLFLERCINAHRSLRHNIGAQRYAQLRRDLLFTNDPDFDAKIDELIDIPAESAWFDKMVSQELADCFSQKRLQQEQFKTTYQQLMRRVESDLTIMPLRRLPTGQINEICNYAIQSGGKRLRSVLAYYMGQSVYGFRDDQCRDMACMLEYMHTASLIFDDLPSQDDAPLRRGKKTVHMKYDSEATAELSAVYLMMRAVEIQSDITTHPSQAVLNSLKYAANTTQLICEGQLQDLGTEHKYSNLGEIENMYWLKTGLAIEAALVIPAILAMQDDIHISILKKLARHMGLAFQIKDDLLDITEYAEVLGKPVAQDINKQTIIDFLSEEEATERMFTHYYQALEIIDKHLTTSNDFLAPLLNFIIYRTH